MKLWWSPTKCADQCHHVVLKVWAGGEAESATPATICRDLQSAGCWVLPCGALQARTRCCYNPRTHAAVPAQYQQQCSVRCRWSRVRCSTLHLCSGHAAPLALTLSPLTRTRVHIITIKYAKWALIFWNGVCLWKKNNFCVSGWWRFLMFPPFLDIPIFHNPYNPP